MQVPIHAPVTETLSTLTRDQLQKLLQYAINEDPGGVLGRVFQYIGTIQCHLCKLNLDMFQFSMIMLSHAKASCCVKHSGIHVNHTSFLNFILAFCSACNMLLQKVDKAVLHSNLFCHEI